MRRWVIAPVVLAAWSIVGVGAAPDLSVGDVRVVEGDAGERSVDITLSLSQAATAPIAVPYTTKDGSAAAGTDYRAATGTVSFARGETTKRITVKIVGDTAVEADEAFAVVLGPAAAVTIADDTATTTIVNDDFAARAGNAPAVYEIRLTWVGSTGFMAGAQGCPVRDNGRAVLTGLVSGVDRVPADEDIEYRGVLHYEADLDLCEVRPGARSDEAQLCAITVVGGGPMNVELTVNEGDRGGYIKAKKTPGRWASNLFGSCDAGLISEERAMFPDESIANIFNGTDLPLKSGPLRVGQYRDGSVLVEVLRVVR